MSDLDRRIATEVMGEDEPPALRWGNEPWKDIPVFEDGSLVSADEWKSEGGNWQVVSIFEHGDKPEWRPASFSSSLEEALRAVDECLGASNLWLRLDYCAPLQEWDAYLVDAAGNERLEIDGVFHKAGVAICNLLLDLKTAKT